MELPRSCIDGVGFSRLSSQAQRVDRTRGFIIRGSEHHLLANIQLEGHGMVSQDGRNAILTPGSLTFVDSSRLEVVAHECGFGGAAQLHRAFRQVTAITPGAYREGSGTD
ncbi:MAG: AraC-family transcriptional regulator [Amycolatopsis sp.]|uniref:hypothetical protein n=1 Tax=Amycolatopsis sp. TaxID=37632 RepID=UPI0026104AFB|nr:hypothetical protein [Amycolatopsis sp.]MCU1683986.1 AraC-family transcriptional regulator [Amycolatopsis sp.]